MIRYKFQLRGNALTRTEAHPIYKDDLSKEIAFETGQYFRRENLSTQLTFIREDYDYIMQQYITTKIHLYIQVDWGNGSWVDYWHGSFHLTDCTINTDDKNIKVKPIVEDRYNTILAGIDKEYDLIKLKPALQAFSYWRRPLLQVYVQGEDKITNYLSGMAWEEDVTDSGYNAAQLHGDYYFEQLAQPMQITIQLPPYPALSNGFFSAYTPTQAHDQYTTGEWRDFEQPELWTIQYYMVYYQRRELNQQQQTIWFNGVRIFDKNDNSLCWEFEQLYASIPSTFTMIAKKSGLSSITCETSYKHIWSRILIASQFTGSLPLPANDIVANNRNYRYVYGWASVGMIKVCGVYSSEPTEWGKVTGTNKYYTKPVLNPDEQLVVRAQYPISQSVWGKMSIWLEWGGDVDYMDTYYMTDTTCRDAFKIEDVIQALLTAVGSSATFAGTTEYSQFLFGTNPLAPTQFGKLLMTAKSNILVAEYSQPAQKAPITLGEVFSMLKNALGLYWYIDDNNRLRIEHISFFKNGGSYTQAPSVGLDLTAMQNVRNGRSWAMATGTYSYDKIEMPERYEYAWADNTTEPFKGKAIEVRSTFVQEGHVEDINVAKFNSDLDYMLLNPNDVSKDGFALVCCQLSSGNYHTRMAELEVDADTKVRLQNYELAMIKLQPNFLISDMPAYAIKVNGADATAKGVQRKKQQTINVPLGATDGDMSQLIRTTIGDGEVAKATINLSSRMAKIQLRYDTL